MTWYRKLIAQGKCPKCRRQMRDEWDLNMCPNCAEEHRINALRYWRNKKGNVKNARRCVRCGELGHFAKTCKKAVA